MTLRFCQGCTLYQAKFGAWLWVDQLVKLHAGRLEREAKWAAELSQRLKEETGQSSLSFIDHAEGRLWLFSFERPDGTVWTSEVTQTLNVTPEQAALTLLRRWREP